MILITKVEYRDIGDDSGRATLHHHHGYGVNGRVTQEVVKGRRFTAPNGRDVVIGNSADPAGVLGIQLEAFENQRRVITDTEMMLRKANLYLALADRKWHMARKASFATRLKWLFKGVDLGGEE